MTEILNATWLRDRWSRGLAALTRMRQEERWAHMPQPTTDPKINYILYLLEEMRTAVVMVEQAEQELKRRQKVLRELEGEIPEAMDDAEIRKLNLDNGQIMATETDYNPSIKTEGGSAVYQWIRKIGRDDILKRTVTVEFEKGQDALAGKLIQAIKKALPNHEVQDRVYIHPSTLKTFAREVSEAGLTLPEELTIFTLRRVKFTWKRGKKPQKEEPQDGS